MNTVEKWCNLNFYRIRIIFLSYILILISLLCFTLYAGTRSDSLRQSVGMVAGWVGQAGTTLGGLFVSDTTDADRQKEDWYKSNTNVNVNINTNINTTTTSTTRTVTATPAAAVQPKPVTTKPCYRFRVVHLDNSTSYLCYSLADYKTLVDLGNRLSSAKSFYQFHIDSAADYQAQYDRTKVSMYLDAKASQDTSAAREKEKIGTITLQMQEIEKRGY